MKKFIIYISGLTVLVLILGVLIVYGFFDVSGGKAQLIGSSKITNIGLDIHNHIVETVNEIGIGTRDLNDLFADFNLESDIGILEEKVNNISHEIELIKNYMNKNQFRRNKEKIEETFNTDYIIKLINYENAYKRVLAYAKENAFDDISLNSFKKTCQKVFDDYREAHNLFTDQLNRVRRY
ncbi:hypothetical protein J7J83_00320 [bacterium]|nr:hypothetical protein [bacterium]